MFSFGGSELFIVAVLVLLLFGPEKIPQFARTIGRYVREFNKYKDIMESTIRMEMGGSDEKSDWQKDYEERLAAGKAEDADAGAEHASGEAGGEEGAEATPAPLEPSTVTATSEDDEEDEE